MKLYPAILCVLVVDLCCCKKPVPPKPEPPEIKPVHAEMIDKCMPLSVTDVVCPVGVFKAGVAGCIDNWEAAKMYRVERDRAIELSTVDQKEMQGTIEILRDRVDELETQRWYWAVVGIALGSVATGLVVGLVK